MKRIFTEFKVIKLNHFENTLLAIQYLSLYIMQSHFGMWCYFEKEKSVKLMMLQTKIRCNNDV